MKTVHIYIRTQVTVDDADANALAAHVGDVQSAIADFGGDAGSVHVVDVDGPLTEPASVVVDVAPETEES